MNHFTTFSQYEYVRPDFENAKELIRKSVDKIKNAGTKEAVSKVFKAVNDQQRHLRTMATVAEIRNTIDTTDPFYESEMQCFYENMPLVDLEMQEFQKQNGVSMVSGCLPMLIQLPILYALFYLFQNAYVYVDVIGHNYTDIANAIVNIPVSLRMEVFHPYAQEFANAYKNVAIIKDGIDMRQVNEVVMLVNYLKPDDWNVILQNLGDAGSSLVPLLATKSSIETFLTIPLVSKAGLHFPGIIIPIAAGVTTWLQSKIMMMMNPQNSDSGNPAAAMTKSMLYTMPIMMGVFAINMPAGLGLYWTISNLFGILQQVILSKHYKQKFAEEAAQ